MLVIGCGMIVAYSTSWEFLMLSRGLCEKEGGGRRQVKFVLPVVSNVVFAVYR